MDQFGKLYLIPSLIAPDTASIIPEHTKLVISDISYFLVENIRSARRYISSLKLGIEIERLQFEVYDKNTSFEEILELLNPVLNGRSAGIISEAGCPGVADPGSIAVSAAHQLDIDVVPLTGPSSILLALMASGLNGQSFAFHGYLPIDKQERKKKLRFLESLALRDGQSQIVMETPYRNEQLFKATIDTCHPNTRLCIATNLTYPDEFIKTLSIQSWKKKKTNLHKKPTIFIIGN